MAAKHSIMKQSIFFWVIGHRLSFENGLKKFLFGVWRNFFGCSQRIYLRLFSSFGVNFIVKVTFLHFVTCH